MPTIGKIGILVSIALLSLPPAGADPGRYSFSLSPLQGILYGHAEEIVYKYPAEDQYLSELLWDLKPLVFIGLGAELGPEDPFKNNGFIASTSLKYGLPLKTGIMEDRDWLNSNYEYLTNYSRHEAYSRNAILMDLSAGYSWRLADYLAFSMVLEFSYMYFSWYAQDGYLQYPKDHLGNYLYDQAWNRNLPKDAIYGKCIQYNQNWFILSHGISLKGRINSYFSLEGNFNYSPLVYAAARDDHLLSKTIFWDYCSFGHYFSLGGKIFFKPYEKLDLSVSVLYTTVAGRRGTSYYAGSNTSNIRYQSANDGGAAFSALELEFAVRIFIFRKR